MTDIFNASNDSAAEQKDVKVDTISLQAPFVLLRDEVIFPHTHALLYLGRGASLQALRASLKHAGRLLLVFEKDGASKLTSKASDEKNISETADHSDLLEQIITLEHTKAHRQTADIRNLTIEDVHPLGVLVEVLETASVEKKRKKILIKALERVRLLNIENEQITYDILSDVKQSDHGLENIDVIRQVLEKELNVLAQTLLQSEGIDIIRDLKSVVDPAIFSDRLAQLLSLEYEQKVRLILTPSPHERLEILLLYVHQEIERQEAAKRVQNRVRDQLQKHQKDMYLQEQMRAIRKEMGEDSEGDDLEKLESTIKKIPVDAAKERGLQELRKFRQNPSSGEAAVIRGWLDWLCSLPWAKTATLEKDFIRAETSLEKSHNGLEKIKKKVLEFLAVHHRKQSTEGPILCFVGPPGVGKTSFVRAVAKAYKRPFVRIALGGVHDESEIRGHRRTYVGAMPGKILHAMKKAGVKNPLILLDEIDKMGHDFRGDPASALLEVLDHEQNHSFMDHFLDVPFDLSKVMFIATANSTNMPRALKDRLEIVSFSSYTHEEKRDIALAHLIQQSEKASGLKKNECIIDGHLVDILIDRYTREAGVRQLSRLIGSIHRQVLKKILEKTIKKEKITEDMLVDFLGPAPFDSKEILSHSHEGVVTGLAWTDVGGETLMVEAVLTPGKGELVLTGHLGDVMKESARAALSVAKLHAARLGIEIPDLTKNEVHVHVPGGAIPKDGPSAGLALSTALLSLFTHRKVDPLIAMTGEVNLRGEVRAIGGLKEKLIAAQRAGVARVLIPKENIKDLYDVPVSVKEALHVIPVANVEEAWQYTFVQD